MHQRLAGPLALLIFLITSQSTALGQTKKDAATQQEKPIRAMLITGGCCHDYATQKLIITEGISARTNLKIEWTIVHQGGTTTDAKIPLYKNKDWAKGYDIVIHNECFAGIGDKEWIERVLKPHREGVNAMVIHCAMHTFRDFQENGYRDFLGVTSKSHGPHHSFKVENLAKDDPVMKGFGDEWITPKGELYYVDNIGGRATPLARAFSSGGRKKQEVCIWKNTYGKARVFGTTIGHHNETMASPKYLEMLTRGFLWAVGRLDEKHIVRPPTKKVPVNLALNRPATSSAHQQGHLPRGATDGSLETRYCADNNDPGDWFQVDLGTPQEIAAVEVHWEHSGGRYRFKLEGSEDGKQWSLLHDATKNEARQQTQLYPAKAKKVRYVRMTCTETESGAWFSFWEFRVHGTQMVEVDENPAYLKKMPLNDPAALLREVKVPAGFEARLFAAPPQVNYPVCLTSTYDGVVYVGIDKNGSLDRKEGRGSVVRCRDTNDDGVADEFIKFCEVDSPRGLVWDRNKLYVLHPPDLSVFYDDDLDGKADRKETLVKGIGFGLDFRGADHTTNGIRMGIDGWIYVAVGDYGFINATAKDGKSLQLKGGGVVRVRPDGSDLEVYARGLRNICDVAIDPEMNLYTRDNTNDGGGWDIRLSHIVQSANYGYPSLYKNFNDEIMPPLADYGGGSGTGALYVSNTSLPDKYQDALFTCDWGRNEIYFHPLKDLGATYSAEQEVFLKIPRPTDMDIDAKGNLYVASWRRGQFKYQGENIGFVVVLSPKSAAPSPQPANIKKETDLFKVPDRDLVTLLRSSADAIRWEAVREIKRRDRSESFEPMIRKLLDNDLPLSNRIAAIAALPPTFSEQLLGEAVQAKDWQWVVPLIRFASDNRKVDGKTASLIRELLAAPHPKVRRAALIAIGRINQGGTLDIVEQFSNIQIDRGKDKGVKTPVNTNSKALRHIAVQTLAQLGNANELLQSARKDSQAHQLAFDAIKYIHSEEAVSGIMDWLSQQPADEKAWESLVRLYFKESPYKRGEWWGTRPDTRGPYYKTMTWESSDRIAQFIESRFAQLNPPTREFLGRQLLKHRVKLPGIQALVEKAMQNNSQKGAGEIVVKVPEFDKNNPHHLGNIDYDEIVVQLQSNKGRVKQGERLFKQQACNACHTIQAGANAIGPQLADIGKRYRKNELIESILKPNAKIAQGFTTQIIATDDGLTHTGFVTREAGDEIEIRTAEGKSKVISKDAIEARKNAKHSVMPEGLVNNLTVDELASLIAYLQSLKSK